MTDIVERLRDCHLVFKHKDIAEAADEIVRLRKVAAFLKGKVSVEQAAIWRDWEIVGFRDYEYRNPDNDEPSP